mgnify:CR=1 FL=1
MESYIFEDDEVGQRFITELIVKQRVGVQAIVIRDSVATLSPPEFFTRLSDAGIQVLEFNPVNPMTAKPSWEMNRRDHRKLLLVDGRMAFLGGITISSVNSRAAHFVWVPRSVQARHCPGETPACTSKARWSASCKSCSCKPGSSRKVPRRHPAITFPAAAHKGDEVLRAIGSSPDAPHSLAYVTLISALRSAQREMKGSEAARLCVVPYR